MLKPHLNDECFYIYQAKIWANVRQTTANMPIMNLFCLKFYTFKQKLNNIRKKKNHMLRRLKYYDKHSNKLAKKRGKMYLIMNKLKKI